MSVTSITQSFPSVARIKELRRSISSQKAIVNALPKEEIIKIVTVAAKKPDTVFFTSPEHVPALRQVFRRAKGYSKNTWKFPEKPDEAFIETAIKKDPIIPNFDGKILKFRSPSSEGMDQTSLLIPRIFGASINPPPKIVRAFGKQRVDAAPQSGALQLANSLAKASIDDFRGKMPKEDSRRALFEDLRKHGRYLSDLENLLRALVPKKA